MTVISPNLFAWTIVAALDLFCFNLLCSIKPRINRVGAIKLETNEAIILGLDQTIWQEPMPVDAVFDRGARREIPGVGTEYKLDFRSATSGQYRRRNIFRPLGQWIPVDEHNSQNKVTPTTHMVSRFVISCKK